MHPVEEYQDIALTVDGLNECDLWRPQEQLYNPGEDRKSDQLEKSCGRENQHSAKGGRRTTDWAVEVQISWREDVGIRNMSQRGWVPRPPVEQPRRTGKKNCYGHKSGGQYVSVLFSFQLPLTVKPLVTFSSLSNKASGIFSKELCRSSL